MGNPPQNIRISVPSRSGVKNVDGERIDYSIIVHSHLRWDWVWQRPQQFLSRLSKKHRILFIEAPCPSDEVRAAKATLREVSDYPNIIVLQMQMPALRWSDGAWV